VAFANKVLNDDTEPGFRLTLAHKDMSLIVNAANAVNAPVPLGSIGARVHVDGQGQRLCRTGFLRPARSLVRAGRRAEGPVQEGKLKRCRRSLSSPGDWRSGIFAQIKACGVQQMAYVPDAGHASLIKGVPCRRRHWMHGADHRRRGALRCWPVPSLGACAASC
jgi:hypothetical protein